MYRYFCASVSTTTVKELLWTDKLHAKTGLNFHVEHLCWSEQAFKLIVEHGKSSHVCIITCKDVFLILHLNRHYFNKEGDFNNLTAAAFHKKTHILVTGFASGAFHLHEMPEFDLIHSLRFAIFQVNICQIIFPVGMMRLRLFQLWRPFYLHLEKQWYFS